MNKTSERFVYFTRHGECVANVEGRVAGGGDDSPLTEKGREQAKQTAESLGGIAFNLVIASPLSRAQDTAKIITTELDIDTPIETDGRIIERDVGRFTGLPKEVYFAAEKAGEEAGESAEDMQTRVREFLHDLSERNFTENALVVSHNGTIRVIKTVLEGLPAEEFVNMPQLTNGEVYKVNIQDITES